MYPSLRHECCIDPWAMFIAELFRILFVVAAILLLAEGISVSVSARRIHR